MEGPSIASWMMQVSILSLTHSKISSKPSHHAPSQPAVPQGFQLLPCSAPELMASFASAGSLPAALQRGELTARPCSSLQCRTSFRHGPAAARLSSSSLHRSPRSRGSSLRVSAQQTSTEPAGAVTEHCLSTCLFSFHC